MSISAQAGMEPAPLSGTWTAAASGIEKLAEEVIAHAVWGGSPDQLAGRCSELVDALRETAPTAAAAEIRTCYEAALRNALFGPLGTSGEQDAAAKWSVSTWDVTDLVDLDEDFFFARAEELESMSWAVPGGRWSADTVASHWLPYFITTGYWCEVVTNGDRYWYVIRMMEEYDGVELYGPCECSSPGGPVGAVEDFAASLGGWTGPYKDRFNTYYASVEASEEVFKLTTLIPETGRWDDYSGWNDRLWDDDVPGPNELADLLAPELASRAGITPSEAAEQLREALPGLSVKEPGPLCDVVWEAAKFLTEWPGGSELLGEREDPRLW